VLEQIGKLHLSSEFVIALYEQIVLELAELGEMETARDFLRETEAMQSLKGTEVHVLCFCATSTEQVSYRVALESFTILSGSCDNRSSALRKLMVPHPPRNRDGSIFVNLFAVKSAKFQLRDSFPFCSKR
jgi:hypothetical protein